MQGSSLPSTDARLLTDILNANTVPLDNVAVLRLRMLVARSLPLARRHNYRVVARTERTSLVAFRSGPSIGILASGARILERFKNILDTEERERDYSLALESIRFHLSRRRIVIPYSQGDERDRFSGITPSFIIFASLKIVIDDSILGKERGTVRDIYRLAWNYSKFTILAIKQIRIELGLRVEIIVVIGAYFRNAFSNPANNIRHLR